MSHRLDTRPYIFRLFFIALLAAFVLAFIFLYLLKLLLSFHSHLINHSASQGANHVSLTKSVN